MADHPVDTDTAQASIFSPEGLEHESNPVNDLLLEINHILKKLDRKKDIFLAIENAFRKKEGILLSTTMNLWYKKYDIEVTERTKTERKLSQTLEANKILCAEVARTSSPQRSPSNKDLSTSFGQHSAFKSNLEESPRQLSSKVSPSEVDLTFNKTEDLVVFHPFSSMEIAQDSDSLKSCPLCSQHLHSVYLDLEQKSEQIAELDQLIAKMTHKGQILISQASMFTAENGRLEKLNKDLQEAVRALESHLANSITENNIVTKNYLAIIEEKRLESITQNQKISQMEEVIRDLSEKIKLNAKESRLPMKPQVQDQRKDDSLATVKQMHNQNNNRGVKNNKINKPLIEKSKKGGTEMFILDKIYPDRPKSGIFLEEFSKIYVGKQDFKGSTDDEIIHKLIEGCITPKHLEDDERTTAERKATSTPEDSRRKAKESKGLGDYAFTNQNARLQGRRPCDCSLI